MKHTIFGAVVALVLLLGSPVANSCTFDFGCGIGSECVKSPGAVSGSCVGGLLSGNNSGSCSFDSDCGIGAKCEKAGGVFGRCVSEVASSCSYDSDCGAGSLCTIPSGSLVGSCVSNLLPGNNNESFIPPDPAGSSGNTCYFDSDCGNSSICSKGTGVFGVCIGDKVRVDPFKQP